MMLHQIKILQPELFNAQPLKNITKFDVGVKVCIRCSAGISTIHRILTWAEEETYLCISLRESHILPNKFKENNIKVL